MFTGDRSGDWIFAALWRAGLANQPTSTHIGDGLELTDVRVAAAVRCAPPANAPTPEERDTCSPWLARELALLPRLRVVVVLGGFGWTALWPVLAAAGYAVPRPRPAFGHGVEVALTGPRGPLTLLGSYHVSQQNTFTGTAHRADAGRRPGPCHRGRGAPLALTGMASNPRPQSRPVVLIVGGGYVGLYTALRLQKKLVPRPGGDRAWSTRSRT